jgi:hypothetical protein
MKNLGMMNYILGLEVWQRIDGIFLSQGKYIVEILKKFEMLNLKPNDYTRPNIFYAVSALSQFMVSRDRHTGFL